jgi:hypothetical protein
LSVQKSSLPKFFGEQNLINKNFPLDNSLGIVTTFALKKIFIDSFGQTKTSFPFEILNGRGARVSANFQQESSLGR